MKRNKYKQHYEPDSNLGTPKRSRTRKKKKAAAKESQGSQEFGIEVDLRRSSNESYSSELFVQHTPQAVESDVNDDDYDQSMPADDHHREDVPEYWYDAETGVECDSEEEQEEERSRENSEESENYEEEYCESDVFEDQQFSDDVFYNFGEYTNEPVVLGGCSAIETILIVFASASKHGWSDTAIEDIFNIINLVIGRRKFPDTNYKVKQVFNFTKSVMQLYLYCQTCMQFLGKVTKNSASKICDVCKQTITLSLVSKNYFGIPNLKYMFKNTLEKPGVRENFQEEIPNEQGIYRDIYDGRTHRNLFENLDRKVYCSYNLFVDGLQLFKGSKNTCWAIVASLNCLPPLIRFKEMVLCGVWFNKKEPSMEIFLKPFVDEANSLSETGIQWSSGNEQIRQTKFVPLAVVADGAARPKLQCMTCHKGEKSCNNCYHPNVAIGRNYNRFEQEENLFEARTDSTWNENIRKAEESGRRVDGVIGKPMLLNLNHISMISSFGAEWMHSVCLGISKYFPDHFWFQYSRHQYYIGAKWKIDFMEHVFKNLKLPCNTDSRLPRSFSERAKWKASEFKWWLLYLSLPILSVILPPLYVAHWALLVKSVYLLDQEEVLERDINQAEEMLLRFVWGVQLLYGKEFMTPNVHSMLHLAESVRKFGPLWTHSAFCYESYLCRFKKYTTGCNGVVNQIIERCIRKTFLCTHTKQLCSSPKVLDFIDKAINSRALCEEHDGATGCGKSRLNSKNDLIYDKLILNHTVYRTVQSQINTRNMDSCIMLHDGSFCMLIKIVEKADRLLLTVQEIEFSPVATRYEETATFDIPAIHFDHLYQIKEFGQEKIISTEMVKEKCIVFEVRKVKYICKFVNFVESQ